VRLILSQSPGLHSIAWVDASGEHSWAYPPEVGCPRSTSTSCAPAAPRCGAPWCSAGAAEDGEPRLRILAPLRERGALSGWLAATYSSRELFRRSSRASTPRSPSTSPRATSICTARSPPRATIRRTRSATPRSSARRDLKIEIAVEPSDEVIAAAHSRLPGATLAGGLALSVLATLALYQRNVAAQHARALEGEIAGHERAEAEVRRLNTGLEERVRERTSELERSNDELQKFASFLSHELRQPLGTQMIWIELLESQAGARSTRPRSAISRRSARWRSDVGPDLGADRDHAAARVARGERSRRSRRGRARGDRRARRRRSRRSGAKVSVGALPHRARRRGPAHPAVPQPARQRAQVPPRRRAVRDRDQRPVASDPAFAGGCEIAVEDNGRGFAPEDAERIFAPRERLDVEGPRARASASRSARRSSTGTAAACAPRAARRRRHVPDRAAGISDLPVKISDRRRGLRPNV
jgi:signal transduction histidine kinase